MKNDPIQTMFDQLREEIRSQVHAEIVGRLERGSSNANIVSTAKKPRKKPPVQRCPIPRCKGRAAPVFGMVCAKHKDFPKAKVRKYRALRRAAKAKK